MTWATESKRRAELPRDWETIRTIVMDRAGHRCEHAEDGQRCVRRATDCDHIADPHDHRPEALQALCADHHKAKTAREAAAGRAAVRANGRRPTDLHPGLKLDDRPDRDATEQGAGGLAPGLAAGPVRAEEKGPGHAAASFSSPGHVAARPGFGPRRAV